MTDAYPITATIASTLYHTFPGTQVTVCCLVLADGSCFTGQSTSGDADAFEQARMKIWADEGSTDIQIANTENAK